MFTEIRRKHSIITSIKINKIQNIFEYKLEGNLKTQIQNRTLNICIRPIQLLTTLKIIYQLIYFNCMGKGIQALALIMCLVTFTYCQGVIILNPGCKQFDSSGKCSSCSNRFYKDAAGICQPVNPNCKTYKNQNGACTSCYDGFSIIEDVCLPKLSLGQIQGLLGPLANCNELGNDGTCRKCSTGYYFDLNRNCKKVPDTCANFDINQARCLGCYQGYALNGNNQCMISTQTTSDPGCNKFENGKCVKCSFGFYFGKNGVCKLIPPTCQNFDTSNQKCYQCYPGYTLDAWSNCIQAPPAVADPGCSKFQNGKCTKCSFGFYFDKNRICKMTPPTCSNFDEISQVCNGCYPGYTLSNTKQCVESTASVTDLGCSKFQNGVCVKCSVGYYFNRNKICRMIPPTCGSFDTTREVCNACYPGYAIDRDGNCVVSLATSVADLGCNSFENGRCVKCSFGYYFDRNRNCKLIPPTCQNFDTLNERCLACYPGYTLDQSNQCIQSTTGVTDYGCAKFDKNVCIRCSVGYYFDNNNMCKITPPTCSIWDSGRQICLGCYPGYSLDSNKQCIRSVEVVSDMGCNKFENGRCVKCSVGYYFNMFGQCMQIPSSCSNFDTSRNLCIGCFPGYDLNSRSQCVVSATGAVSDLNCKQFKNGLCVQCSQGAFFDASGKCIISDPLCKRFNAIQKRCEECYPGFSLNYDSYTCKESDPASIDPNCKSFKNNECLECSFRFYKDVDGICKQVDPNCRLYNTANGQCNGCYEGYKLINRRCEKDTTTVSDPNCAEWKNGMCMKCAFGSYFSPTGGCVMVDPLCQTWDDRTGACRSCYPSFQIAGTKCVPSKADNLDPNCAQFSKGVCTRCSKGFYFNSNGLCAQVDPQCQTFDSKFGKCLSCFNGYKLDNGRCFQDVQAISDFNCAQFKNSVCVKCSLGFYFDKNQRCRASNPQCRIFDTVNQRCSQCYAGYILQGRDCIVSTKSNLCAEWKDGMCLRCANRAHFNDQGGCSQVDQLCNTYDIFDGECQSCYGGFQLISGKCIKKSQQSANGCIDYNSANQCVRCEKRRFLENGVCQKIDDFCDEFNFITNSCTKCYSGYQVSNRKCVISQVKTDSEVQNCFTYSLQGSCVQCYDRFYLKNNTCNEVNVFCKKYDVSNGDCLDCYTGFKLEKGKCVRK